jgi:hypothetical protein
MFGRFILSTVLALILVVAMIFFLVACVAPAGTSGKPPAPAPDRLPIPSPAVYLETGAGGIGGIGSQVWRWEDPTYRVICWQSQVGYSGGISCLPEDQLQPR